MFWSADWHCKRELHRKKRITCSDLPTDTGRDGGRGHRRKRKTCSDLLTATGRGGGGGGGGIGRKKKTFSDLLTDTGRKRRHVLYNSLLNFFQLSATRHCPGLTYLNKGRVAYRPLPAWTLMNLRKIDVEVCRSLTWVWFSANHEQFFRQNSCICSVADPGCLSRIRIFSPSRIQGQKDSGSRIRSIFNPKNCF
jgi:hypothetical protein